MEEPAQSSLNSQLEEAAGIIHCRIMAQKRCIAVSVGESAMLCMLCMTHSLLELQDDKTAWVQLTVKIPSEQSFAAYSAKKSLVAGNPDKAIKVEDTWVFERALKKDPTTRSGPVKQSTACIMHHLIEAAAVPP